MDSFMKLLHSTYQLNYLHIDKYQVVMPIALQFGIIFFFTVTILITITYTFN